MEGQYIYEVGLTPDDKRNIKMQLGVSTLSLTDYENAMNVINELDQ